MDHSNYITVIKTNGGHNKKVILDAKGKGIKGVIPPLSEGRAKTMEVNTQQDFVDVLKQVQDDEELVMILGYIPETIGQGEYPLLSKDKLKNHTGQDKAYARLKDNFVQSNWFLMDHDQDDHTPKNLVFKAPKEVDEALVKMVPGIDGWIRTASNSSRILIDGQPYKTGTNCHYFIQAKDAKDIGRFGKALLVDAMVNTGYGFKKYRYAKATGDICGSQAWSVFDPSTYSPERLVFEGKPTVSNSGGDNPDHTIEVIPGSIELHAGLALDTSTIKSPDKKTSKKFKKKSGGSYCQSNKGDYFNYQIKPGTMVETTKHGDMTFLAYAESEHKKLRAQSPFRESSSEAAYLNRHKDGSAFLWDAGIKYTCDDIKPDQGESEEQGSLASKLVAMVKDNAELFHDKYGEGYASFEQEGCKQTWALHSSGFKDWLAFKVYNELGLVPADTLIKTSIATLTGIAKYDGQEEPVYMRCAPFKDGYVIDLTNSGWDVIEVCPRGWQVVSKSPVKFIRSHTAAPLPVPVPGGDVSLWFKYLNVNPNDHTLILADALDSWRPDTPYTVLAWVGEHGSGKSTSHACYRQLTDPNTIPLRTAPKGVEDLYVSAGVNYQASFENMSNLTPAIQDALCVLATGGGHAKRKLYSDSDETTIEIKRKVVINGIEDVITRPDLVDRSIRIEVPILAQVMDERTFQENFEADRPEILGGLLDLFVEVLKAIPNIKLKGNTRMIGFATLGEAVHQARNVKESFLDQYMANKTESMATTLDSSPAALSVVEFIQGRNGKPWVGSMKALLDLLADDYHQTGDGWPKSPKGLGGVLQRVKPALRSQGIHIKSMGRKRDGYHIKISGTPTP